MIENFPAQPPQWLAQVVRKENSAITQMDKTYKEDIPRYKRALIDLKREFSRRLWPTNWIKLRIEPLLKHVTSLERVLLAPQYSREHARLRRGVGMFHSDLVYLRTNIKALKDLLADEKPVEGRSRRTQRQSQRSRRGAPETGQRK